MIEQIDRTRDDLAPARGILFGCGLGFALWLTGLTAAVLVVSFL